jgi:hypothetical protein
MEQNQDSTTNKLIVLDDTIATSNDGCATFNGGILVEKNVYACDICAIGAEVSSLKVLDSMSVKNTLHANGNIVPASTMNTSTVGSITHKFENMYSLGADIHTVKSSHIDSTDAKLTNIQTIYDVLDISENTSSDVSFNVCLATFGIYITVKTLSENKNIELIVPAPAVPYQTHFINLKQNNNASITWTINGVKRVSKDNNQIIHLQGNATAPLKWTDAYSDSNSHTLTSAMNAGFANIDTSFNSLKTSLETIEQHDTSLNALQASFDFLTELNAFASLDAAGDMSITNYIENHTETQEHLTSLDNSISTLSNTINSQATTLQNLSTSVTLHNTKVDLSSNKLRTDHETLKALTNNTFTTVNTFMGTTNATLDCLKSEIATLKTEVAYLKTQSNSTALTLNDVNKTMERNVNFLNARQIDINKNVNTILKYLNLSST